jgi:flagellar motility protein MotE (MotC chaperone)
MMRLHRGLAIAALVLAGSLASWAQPADTPSQLEAEQRLIELASTPAEHEALAKRFHAEADRLRMMALAHRSMGDSYRRSKMRKAEEQKEHCERIAALEEKISTEYERLSREHAAQLPR